MKSICLLLLVGCVLLLGACDSLDADTAAQELQIKPQQAIAPSYKTKVESYDFDISGKKDGYHVIAKNPTTGNILKVLIRNKSVASISIKGADGKVGKFTNVIYRSSYNNPNSEAPPIDIFDCPDGWNWRCVCYIHPLYGYLCFSYCTPTQLVFSLPSGW